jgi:hypothetical protein
MRERAAQSLNPETGRLGAEDPSTAFSAAPLPADVIGLRQRAGERFEPVHPLGERLE